jgi:hypothetical protein
VSDHTTDIWREFGEKNWWEFVDEIEWWKWRGVLTQADQYLLSTMGISIKFPWWISSLDDLTDRGTPLREKNE